MCEGMFLEEPFCMITSSLPNGGKGGVTDYVYQEMTQEGMSISKLPMGDMIRDARGRGEITAAEIERSKLGYLVPDRIVIPLAKRALDFSVRKGGNLLIEGLPRNVTQARYLIPKLLRHYKVVIQIHLLTPLEECDRRRAERYKMLGREDDLPERFARRVQLYLRHTNPAIKLTEELGVKTYRIPVGWNRPPDEVRERVMSDTPLQWMMQIR